MKQRPFSRPEGPKYASLGQRPRFGRTRTLRPVGPAHQSAHGGCSDPLGLGDFGWNFFLGRRPRLSYGAPLVLNNFMALIAKLEDEIAKGRKEREGVLG